MVELVNKTLGVRVSAPHIKTLKEFLSAYPAETDEFVNLPNCPGEDTELYYWNFDIPNMVWMTEPRVKVVEIPDEISRRQFFQQLAAEEIISEDDALQAMSVGAIPAPLMAIISKLPASAQFDTKMLVMGASTFKINHPMTETAREFLGWSVDRKERFWVNAYKR